MGRSSEVTVVLVDDNEDVRSLMRRLLESDGGFVVVGEATNGRDGVAVCEEQQPEVVVLDVSMPVMDGIEAIPLIRQAAPGTRIAMWSSAPDRRPEALEAGADAWCEKGDAWGTVRRCLLGGD